MSADHTRREINRLDKEIAALEKKRADTEQKEANKINNINNVQSHNLRLRYNKRPPW